MTSQPLPANTHLQQQADGSWILIDDTTGNALTTDPFGGQVTGQGPAASQVQTMGANPAAPTSSTPGVGAMPDWAQFLIWMGALVVLWFILTAIAEAGYADVAHGLAGLLLVGALFLMGPTAVKNAQALTQPKQGS